MWDENEIYKLLWLQKIMTVLLDLDNNSILGQNQSILLLFMLKPVP